MIVSLARRKRSWSTLVFQQTYPTITAVVSWKPMAVIINMQC